MISLTICKSHVRLDTAMVYRRWGISRTDPKGGNFAFRKDGKPAITYCTGHREVFNTESDRWIFFPVDTVTMSSRKDTGIRDD